MRAWPIISTRTRTLLRVLLSVLLFPKDPLHPGGALTPAVFCVRRFYPGHPQGAKGADAIGYYSAITPIVAGLAAWPLGYLGKQAGKKTVMLIGSFSAIAMFLFFLPE